MIIKTEILEDDRAKMTIQVPAEIAAEALSHTDDKEAAFYEVFDKVYPDVMAETDLEIISAPDIIIETFEKDKDMIFTAEVSLVPANVMATDEEVKEAIEGIAAQYGIEYEDVLKMVPPTFIDELKRNIRIDKAMKL